MVVTVEDTSVDDTVKRDTALCLCGTCERYQYGQNEKRFFHCISRSGFALVIYQERCCVPFFEFGPGVVSIRGIYSVRRGLDLRK